MGNNMDIDDTDRAILDLLTQDGRISNVDLAGRVGLTPAPCLRRVKRLEDAGVIAGYRAHLDPVATGRAFCVYMTVEITMTSLDIVEQFETQIASFEEVTEVRRVYGAVDYMVRVDVADGNAYEKFQAEKMYALPGVHRVVSHPTMKLISGT